MATVSLLLGANLGDTNQVFEQTIHHINNTVGEVQQISAAYKTPAWGFDSGNDFLNQVLVLSTLLAPEELLTKLKNIELTLGRDPHKKSVDGVYQDRLIDIDILFYDHIIYSSTSLIIPHPRLHLRKFTLVPLAGLMPDFIHPKLGHTIKKLLEVCTDTTHPEKI